jgi:hypothetical protein
MPIPVSRQTEEKNFRKIRVQNSGSKNVVEFQDNFLMVFWVDIFGRLNFFLSDCLESGMGMTEIIEFLMTSDNMESRAQLFRLPIGGRGARVAVYTVNIFFSLIASKVVWE